MKAEENYDLMERYLLALRDRAKSVISKQDVEAALGRLYAGSRMPLGDLHATFVASQNRDSGNNRRQAILDQKARSAT